MCAEYIANESSDPCSFGDRRSNSGRSKIHFPSFGRFDENKQVKAKASLADFLPHGVFCGPRDAVSNMYQGILLVGFREGRSARRRCHIVLVVAINEGIDTAGGGGLGVLGRAEDRTKTWDGDGVSVLGCVTARQIPRMAMTFRLRFDT